MKPDKSLYPTLQRNVFPIIVAFIVITIFWVNVGSTVELDDGCVTAPANMTSWWTGDGYATDIAGSNDLSLEGDTIYTGGMVWQAFLFDGNNDFAEASGVPDFGTDPFTVDFWMYSATVGDVTYIMGKSDPSGQAGWEIRLDSNTIRLFGFNGWSEDLASGTALSLNTWYHVAVTGTDTLSTLYINGSSEGTCSRNNISSSGIFRVGYTPNHSGSGFTGRIDEIELFNRALTIEEIQSIYNAGPAGKCKTGDLPPDANAGTDHLVMEGETGTLDGSLSFGEIIAWDWTQPAGTMVTLFYPNDVKPTFTAPTVGPDGETLTFQLQVTDYENKQDADTVNVTVYNLFTNAGPDQTVDEGDTVTLDGSASDIHNEMIFDIDWTQQDASDITLANPNTLTTTFTAPDVDSDRTLTFQLYIIDHDGQEDTDTVDVTVVNLIPPVADAGPDKDVDEGDLVTLDGTGSGDPDGSVITMKWEQQGGSDITLSNPNAVQPTFTAPDVTADRDIIFELTVTDDDELQHTDTVTITVQNLLPPVADAGPEQRVDEDERVTLDGSRSRDDDGSIVSYRWRQKGGTSVLLKKAKSVNPSFIAPDVSIVGEKLTFKLTVKDDDGLTCNSLCYVYVGNRFRPEADAGSIQTVTEGETVTLDGSASQDQDGSIIAYSWVQKYETDITLSNPYSSVTTFTAPQVDTDRELIFRLTVIDNDSLRGSKNCYVTVKNNLPPVADAGPDQAVDEGDKVTLDGLASTDPDGSIVSWEWIQETIPGGTLSNPNAAKSSFTAPDVDADTELGFILTVTDDHGLQDSNKVHLTVKNNIPPEADAGSDQSVTEVDTVTLDATASFDSYGTIIGYDWKQKNGTDVTLTSPNTSQPTFVAPTVGPEGETLNFELKVTDNGGLHDTDTVDIFIDNRFADAGPDQTVFEYDSVSLDSSGSVSANQDESLFTYEWTQIGDPNVTINNPDSVHPTFSAPDYNVNEEMLLTFQLTVTDDTGLQDTDTITLEVKQPEEPEEDIEESDLTNHIGICFINTLF